MEAYDPFERGGARGRRPRRRGARRGPGPHVPDRGVVSGGSRGSSLHRAPLRWSSTRITAAAIVERRATCAPTSPATGTSWRRSITPRSWPPALALPADGTPEERVDWARQHWVPARVPGHPVPGRPHAGPHGGRRQTGWGSSGTASAVGPRRRAPLPMPRIGAVVALAPGGAEPPPPGIIPAQARLSFGAAMFRPCTSSPSRTPRCRSTGCTNCSPDRPTPKQMVILRRADHLHFIDDVEEAHEAFRTAPLEGPAAEIQARMQPISELCSGEQAHRFVRGLTLAHLDAALRGPRGGAGVLGRRHRGRARVHAVLDVIVAEP